MTTLAETIAGTDVRPGTVMAWWLSGTGFVLKTPAGTQLYIDPYFSNCVAQIFGIDRAVPPPVPVDAATPDLVIATHWHEDHLDPEALPQLAQRSPTRFLCPPTCRSRLLGWGVPDARITAISAGESHTFRDVQVTAVPAFLKQGGKIDTVTVADYCDHVDYAVKRIGLAPRTFQTSGPSMARTAGRETKPA